MTPSEIKQALEGGETGRELDAAIAVYFGLAFEDGEDAFGYKQYSYRDVDGTIVRPGTDRFIHVPKLTTSVDAALALVEEVLPTAGFKIETVKRSDDTRMGWSVSMSANYRTPHIDAVHKSPAAALCLALINAKEKANA